MTESHRILRIGALGAAVAVVLLLALFVVPLTLLWMLALLACGSWLLWRRAAECAPSTERVG